MNELAIQVRRLTVAYEHKPVLFDVDLDVPKGRLMAIVGPNGAGKSTLVKAILGLIPRVSGTVSVFGKAFSGVDTRVGYVPQRESVDWDFPVSALDVVLMGSYHRVGWFRRPGTRERDAAAKALDEVGMGEFANRQISQLSGGQQQRVFLARALLQQADLYLMDEPFAGVDAATEVAILELLRRMRNEGKTVVAVHHDLQTVADYFDDVALVNLRVFGVGPVAEVMTPERLRQTYSGRLGALETIAKSATGAAS